MSIAFRTFVAVVFGVVTLLAMHGYLNEHSAAKSPHAVSFSPLGKTPFPEHHKTNATFAVGEWELDFGPDKTAFPHPILLLGPAILTGSRSRRRSTRSVHLRDGTPFSTGPPNVGLLHSA
jgi:hypothetical protein